MHSATIIRFFMRIYSLPIKSVKCTLNFSFKLIFRGVLCVYLFLGFVDQVFKARLYKWLFLETTVYHLDERREREESCVLSFQWLYMYFKTVSQFS